MLTLNMKEKNTGIIEFHSLIPEVVDNMLRFIYGFENLPDIENLCQEILEAAELYKIIELKVCFAFIPLINFVT